MEVEEEDEEEEEEEGDLELLDARVYEPQIRALLGTASHFCEVVVLKLRLDRRRKRVRWRWTRMTRRTRRRMAISNVERAWNK